MGFLTLHYIKLSIQQTLLRCGNLKPPVHKQAMRMDHTAK